jgi:hypothetical protein
LHGIEVGRPDRVAAGADADCDGAVIGQQIVALAASVDVERTQSRAEAEGRNIACGARNAGLGEREIDGILKGLIFLYQGQS